GPSSLTPPGAAEIARVQSAEEMRDAVLNLLPQSSIVIKTAAVSDYRARTASRQKIKRKGPMTLELEATPDILKEIVSHKISQLVIGFAAETENALENARQKLVAKNLDAIVVNDVSREGIGFDSDRNAVTIITRDEVVDVPETTKWEVAQRVLDQIVHLRQQRKSPVKA
ncbi:MAG: phosphopantothenoylcysteine decarboxylase, partial [Candidatus Sulfotelmatobacter sp.]